MKKGEEVDLLLVETKTQARVGIMNFPCFLLEEPLTLQ